MIFDVATTRILDVNSYIVDWLGYPLETWSGESLGDRPAWHLDRATQEAFGTLLRDGHVLLERICVTAEDGHRYVADVVANLYTVDGQELGQLNVRDVTVREEAQRKLRESEQRFRLFAASVRDYGFITLDLEGRITSWNIGAEELLGYSPNEIVGEPASRIFTPEDVVQGEDERERQNALLHGRAEDERWHLRKDGTRFWSSGVLTPLHDELGSVCGFSKVLRDITERRLAEESIAKQTEQLIRSNSELQEFSYVTSHDLQEPLRTISNFTGLLRRRYQDRLDSQANEYLDFVSSAVHRMTALIRDLLEYSRSGNIAGVTKKRVNLESVLEWALDNLQTAIKETKASITHDPLPTVLGSEVQFLQLFQNLISNSIKYRGKAPPQIHIGVLRRDNEWEIQIADNGIGIAPQYHDRVFGVFKRLHGRDVPGTGIGLALCRKIVENHGGRIWIESEAGRGAIFHFTLNAGE